MCGTEMNYIIFDPISEKYLGPFQALVDFEDAQIFNNQDAAKNECIGWNATILPIKKQVFDQFFKAEDMETENENLKSVILNRITEIKTLRQQKDGLEERYLDLTYELLNIKNKCKTLNDFVIKER